MVNQPIFERKYLQATTNENMFNMFMYKVYLTLNKKVPAIFHNLKGYDNNLIINEIGKFNVKVDVIPNRLEKYMVVTMNKI